MPSEVVMLQSKDGLTKKFPLSASSVKLDYQNQVDLSTVTTDYTVPADGVVVTDSGEVTVNKGNIVRNTSSSFCVFIPYRHTTALPDETTAENIIAKDSTGANSTIQRVLDGKADSGYPPSVLPEGYTRLEYIESTGTQYIDTGIDDDVVFGEATIAYLSDANPQSFVNFGAYGGNYINFNSVYSRFELGADVVLDIPLGISKINCSFKFEHTNASDTAYITYDDTTKSRQLAGYFKESNLVLLGQISDGSFVRGSKAKLYSCVLKDNNNQIIRDFVPCKNPQNVVGLYDIVNDVFYNNDGTGDFVAGNVISEAPTLKDVADNIKDYVKVIEVTSDSIIPVGTHAGDHFDVEMHYTCPGGYKPLAVILPAKTGTWRYVCPCYANLTRTSFTLNLYMLGEISSGFTIYPIANVLCVRDI